jgi:hypothetical protein
MNTRRMTYYLSKRSDILLSENEAMVIDNSAGIDPNRPITEPVAKRSTTEHRAPDAQNRKAVPVAATPESPFGLCRMSDTQTNHDIVL